MMRTVVDDAGNVGKTEAIKKSTSNRDLSEKGINSFSDIKLVKVPDLSFILMTTVCSSYHCTLTSSLRL